MRFGAPAVIGVLICLTACATALCATTSRVSVDSAGGEGDSASWGPDISSDGRYVAFVSDASDLVVGDTNGFFDVFVHDRDTGVTSRVSVSTAGAQANYDCSRCAISGDGRCVAFYSSADNLVAGDTNGRGDMFVRDRQTGATTRVSVKSGGAQADGSYTLLQAPSLSADGRYVAFATDDGSLVPGDTNALMDVFVHDRQTGDTKRVSVDSAGQQADNASMSASISGDGRYVAFDSCAENLVVGDTNGLWDAFLHDRQTATTTRVSVGDAENEGDGDSFSPSVSADGRYVAFDSSASNLVAGDTNAWSDIFVRDRQAGTTTRCSVSSAGLQADESSQ